MDYKFECTVLGSSSVCEANWPPRAALTPFEVESVLRTVLDETLHLKQLCDGPV